MNNKEILVNSIKESKLSKTDLRKAIYQYLYSCQNYDSMEIKPLTEELMSGTVPDRIKEEDIVQLIKLFNKDVQIQKDVQVQEIKKEEDAVLQDLYNTMVIENKKLKTELDKNIQYTKELEKKNNELTNELDKIKQIIKRLQKFNITEFSEFVEIEDEELNELYFVYITEGKTELNEANIFEKDNHIILPKTYYKYKIKESEVK